MQVMVIIKLWPGHVSDSTQCMRVAVNTFGGERSCDKMLFGPLARLWKSGCLFYRFDHFAECLLPYTGTMMMTRVSMIV